MNNKYGNFVIKSCSRRDSIVAKWTYHYRRRPAAIQRHMHGHLFSFL